MRTEPMHIEGLAGPVVIDANAFTGKHSILVGGRPVTGTRRGLYTLPTADGGTVAAKLHHGVFDPHPSLEIAGVRHRSGPAVPKILGVLTLLPFLLVIGGLVGILIGATAVLANVGVARLPQPSAVKAVLMLVVTAVAVVVFLLVAGALGSAVDT